MSPVAAVSQLGPQRPMGCLGDLGYRRQVPSAFCFLFMLGSGQYFRGGGISTLKQCSKTHGLPLGLKFTNTALPSLSGLCLQFSPLSFSPGQVSSHRGAAHDPLRGAAGGVEMMSVDYFFFDIYSLHRCCSKTKCGDVCVSPLILC